MDLEKLNQSIIQIYEAGLGRSSWDEALASMLSFVDLPTGCIQVQNRKTGQGLVLASKGFGPEHLEEVLGAEWAHHCIWSNALGNRQIHQDIIIGSELVSPTEFEHSTIYNEFFKPMRFDVVDTLSGIKQANQHFLYAAPVYRERNSDPFERETIERYKMLWPHISRSMEVFARTNDDPSLKLVSEARMDALSVALLGVDARGQLVRQNRMAEQMLSEQLFFKKIGAHITCTSPANARKLREAIEVAAPETPFTPRAPQSTHLLLQAENSPHLCTVFVVPNPDHGNLMGQTYQADEPDVFVLASSTTRDNKAKSEAIAKLYDLTPAESQVLASFVQGSSPAQVAEDTGRNIETVRSQLKSIFSKTNTSSQLELLRLVLSMPIT